MPPEGLRPQTDSKVRHITMRAARVLATLAAVSLGLTLASAPAQAGNAAQPDTLREVAKKAGILIGSGAINPAYLDDPQFSVVLADQFNSLSPENELKWFATEPQQGVFDFAG